MPKQPYDHRRLSLACAAVISVLCITGTASKAAAYTIVDSDKFELAISGWAQAGELHVIGRVAGQAAYARLQVGF